jgi:hypothetical protein
MDDDEVRGPIDGIELVNNPMMVGGKIVDKTGGSMQRSEKGVQSDD